MTEEKIRVVYKEPGKKPEIKYIPNELIKFQKMVGGYIETVTLPTDSTSIFEKPIIIVCDEEGKLKNAAPNFFCSYINDTICGPAVFVRESKTGDDFGSLTAKDANLICEQFKFVREI